MSKPKPHFNFELTVNAVQGKISGEKLMLTITPEKSEFPPLEVEITNEQYDAMRYHFVSACDDVNGITKFSIIK